MEATFFSTQNGDQILHMMLRFFYDKHGVKVLERIPLMDLRGQLQKIQEGMQQQGQITAETTLQKLNLHCMSSLKSYIHDLLKIQGPGGTLPPMPGSGELLDAATGATAAESGGALSSDDLMSEDDFQAKVRQLDALRVQVENEVKTSVSDTFLCIQGHQRKWYDNASRTRFLYPSAATKTVSLVRVVVPVMAAASAPFLHVNIGGQEAPLMWSSGSYTPVSSKMATFALSAGPPVEISFTYPDGDPFEAGADGLVIAHTVPGQHHMMLQGPVRELEEIRVQSRVLLRNEKTGVETRHVVRQKRPGKYVSEANVILDPLVETEGRYRVLVMENQVLMYFEVKR